MSEPPFTHAHYREILRAAASSGYRCAGFGDLAAVRGSDGRVCFLRHDCDNDLTAAVAMAEIEAEEAVRSTYFIMLRSAMYNLLAPTNRALIHRILDRGHWLGLHFDESVVAGDRDDHVAAMVDRERRILFAEFGSAVEVVSFHQPGPRVLEGRIKLTCLNTYDPRDMQGVHYTSDSNLTFRGGEPAALFADGSHRKIQLLIHPEWWAGEALPLAEKWNRMLCNNLELMQASLLQREATYTERREIILRPTRAGR